MTISVAPIQDKQVWENFLSSHPEANFLQSWNWGDFYLRLGQKIFRRGFFQNDQLLGVMLLIRENAKRARYLTLAGGPILTWHNEELLTAVLQELQRLGQTEKATFIRVRPQLANDEFAHQIFEKRFAMVKAPMHLSAELTHRLDLNKTQAELLAAMRKATRYEIKKATKLGLRLVTSTRPEDIEQFFKLQLETATRQKFIPFSLEYWQKQFAVFAADNQVLLYSSYFEDKLLAQAMIIFYGQEAVYHYGASTPLARQYPGAYQIQWAAIQEAKKRGLTRYNFWGVAPADNPQHRFAKLSIFKRGFAGQDYAYLPAHDLIIDPLKYKINLIIETGRKKLRRV
jgi:lipid II:glycine glycyltransferase (peptidoglycan interpeptide bridge formation enzyme)